MYESERQQIIDAGIALDRYRLISLSGGNVSVRIGGHILVTPTGDVGIARNTETMTHALPGFLRGERPRSGESDGSRGAGDDDSPARGGR